MKAQVQITADSVVLAGALVVPARAGGIVLFAHGSGSSRHSPRNNFVAGVLRSAGLGTLLMDLLTRVEDVAPEARFDIDLLTRRLEAATRWVAELEQTKSLALGYFGASTGAAAALRAAASLCARICAVFLPGGAPDL